MKKLIKKIGQNKLPFFFFVGLLSLLVIALVVAANTNDTPSRPIDSGITPDPIKDPTVQVKPEETMKVPLATNLEYVVVRKFYEKDGTKEEQELSLIKYQSSYRTSVGTSYALKNGEAFDVLSILSGKVVEIKESPLYGNYVVVEHNDGFKSYYYGLSEVTVTLGSNVNQCDKLGVSGHTEIDAETGNHVYIKIVKDGKHYNPEKLIGKKISEI